MKTETWRILAVLALLAVCVYLVVYFNELECTWYRKFGSLKERAAPSNFRVREKINEHPDSEGVLSTSLFGKKAKYIRALLSGKEGFFPPRWHVRVYLCPDLLNKHRDSLLEKDYELFVMEEPSDGLTGTCWRFLPLEEGKPFLSLDADDFGSFDWDCEELFSRWKKIQRPFIFFMSSPCSPVMAGKWGSSFKYPGLARKLEKYDLTRRGGDELFLKKNIMPLAREHGYLRLKGWGPHAAVLILASALAVIILLGVVDYLKVKMVPKVSRADTMSPSFLNP